MPFDLEKENQKISDLCDWIEEQQALETVCRGYINDAVDCDKEECFI